MLFRVAEDRLKSDDVIGGKFFHKRKRTLTMASIDRRSTKLKAKSTMRLNEAF